MTTRPQLQWSIPRAFPRHLIDQRIVLRSGGVFHGRTKDISEAGLGATVAGELPRNGLVDLEFNLPGEETPLQLKAEIRYQYGFRFVDASEEQRALIREATINLPLAH